MSDLDTMLHEPLTEMPDNGFTAKVVSAIAEARIRRARLEAVTLSAGVAAVLTLLPFTDFGQMLQQQAYLIDGSLPIALALVALTLTAAALQVLRD